MRCGERVPWNGTNGRLNRSEGFYNGSLGSVLFFKARSKSLKMNSRVFRWASGGSKICHMCEWGVDETIVHMLLECHKYERERMGMREIVTQEIGIEEWNRLLEGNIKMVMEFLLGLSILHEGTRRIIID